MASWFFVALALAGADAGPYEHGRSLFSGAGCTKCHGDDAYKPVSTGLVLPRHLQKMTPDAARAAIKTRKSDWTARELEAVLAFLQPCR
jgi:mono/diheme cytochrome c family protein